MAAETAGALLAHAAELERRDQAIAGELEAVRDLEERAGAVRGRAGQVREALQRLPAELEELERLRRDAEAETAAARAELERTASRVEALESSRRQRDDELDRARKEAATAHDAVADAVARFRRLDEGEARLLAEKRKLAAEESTLARSAERIASDLRQVARVAETAGRAPGATLDELDDWGGRVRSALFVARGTLETERERIVTEANVLGASVLGEPLGASSVALVRRRLEAHLAS
jgi:translation initiation factor IF-2